MIRVVHTLTRVLEIVYNSCRFLGITDLVWQLDTTTPTDCVVWNMSSNGGLTFDIILFLSSHQKFKQEQSLRWHSVLKIYFLQKTLPLGFTELTLCYYCQTYCSIRIMSSKINWKQLKITLSHHSYANNVCEIHVTCTIKTWLEVKPHLYRTLVSSRNIAFIWLLSHKQLQRSSRLFNWTVARNILSTVRTQICKKSHFYWTKNVFKKLQ